MRVREPLSSDLRCVNVQLMERVDGNEDVSNIRVDLISSVATLQLLGHRVLKNPERRAAQRLPVRVKARRINLQPARLCNDRFSHAGDRCIVNSGRLPIRTKGWLETTSGDRRLIASFKTSVRRSPS